MGIKPDETFCIKNLYIDSINAVYICSNRGLKRVIINQEKYSVASIENTSFKKIKDLDIRSIVKDNYEQTWVGTDKGVIVLSKNNAENLINHSNFFYNTILDDNINYLFKDAFGNIWITTTKGLNLLMNDQFIFREFNAKSGTLSEMHSIYTLYPDNDSIVFACGATGLFRVNIKNFTFNKILQNEEYGEIESITRINQNEFLVSSDERLLVLKKQLNNFTVTDASKIFEELSPVQLNYFSACLKYNDSIILLASMEDEGLIKWDYKNHSLQQFKNAGNTKNRPYENSFHNIKQDKAGNVWLLSNNSITKYNPQSNEFKNYFPAIKHQSQPHFFFDLYDDGKYLWLTSYGYGLIRFKADSNTYNFYTEKNGFSSNATYNILRENDSVIWISSNKGLTRFNTASEKASAYYLNDGLQSDAFDERSACSIGDHLFFGGIDGFTEISRNALFNTTGKMPVYIGKITYADATGKPVEINAVNPTALKFKTFPISFQIITPDYTNNSRISYAYKVQELNNNWILLGKNNQITLAALSPGKYHFIGKIYNADNIANESKAIEFTILPKWYQTTIFKIALVVLAAMIVYGVYRYRIAQIKMQQAQLHQVREEIANDLHDDIGSTLNSIKIFTHLAEHAADKEKYFDQIKQSLKHVSEGLRDMIWVLDDNNDTAEHLIKRLQLFVKPVAEASNIHIDFIIEGSPGTQLNKKEKRNLLMIAKEAVNNSIKYAECKNIYVAFKIGNEYRSLTIQDDGKGFSEDAITPGNGLKNMRTRAEQIGYNVKLITSTNEGTVIEIRAASKFK